MLPDIGIHYGISRSEIRTKYFVQIGICRQIGKISNTTDIKQNTVFLSGAKE